MKVIVCGGGQVGSNIAAYLAAEENDVTVIDMNSKLVQEVNDYLDVSAIVGNASHPDVLERAGAADADLIIAATQIDEVNMIACQLAHSLFNVTKKIARIREQTYLAPEWQHLFSKDHLPVDLVISPELEVSEAILHRINAAGVFNLIDFADGKIKLASVICDDESPITHTPLKHLTNLFPDLLIEIVAIIRGAEKIIPNAEDTLLPDDEVYFVCDHSHLNRCLQAFGRDTKRARRVIIIGGGNIGLRLAQKIETRYPDIELQIIEQNLQRAHAISQQLKQALVLQGDGLSRSIMDEANAANAEVVVSVMEHDETNVLSSVLAKNCGAARTITLINNDSFVPLISGMGLDAIVSPGAITVSSILEHIRKGRVMAAHTLRDGFAEVMEIEALESSNIVQVPIKDLKLPDDTIIGAIYRDDDVVIPKPDTIIYPQDRVIVLTGHAHVHEIEQLFSVRPDYF